MSARQDDQDLKRLADELEQHRRATGNVLPLSLPPRGLSRTQAAAYVGISASLFDEMVADGRMPKPIRINARAVWDRFKVDEAFGLLSHDDEPNPWDEP
jgi:predicted DNA-binding transcriptional regulator AlpA